MGLSYLTGVVLLNLISILSIIAIQQKVKIPTRQRYLFMRICCISFILIAILGIGITNDVTLYQNKIQFILDTKDPKGILEPFWTTIIQKYRITFIDYLVLLQVVSFSILYCIIRLLNPKNLVYFIGVWVILCLHNIIGGRAILFFMVFYLGVVCIGKGKTVFGILLVLLSIPIHKTAYIAIPILCISLLKLNRKTIRYLLIGLIVISLYAKIFIINNLPIIYAFLSENEVGGAVYLTYEADVNASGHWIWPLVANLKRIIFYLLGYIVLRAIDISSQNDRQIRLQYNLSLWGLLISGSLFIIDLPDPSIATRVLYIILAVPLPFLVSIVGGQSSKSSKSNYIVPLLWSYLILTDIGIYRVGIINQVL